MFHLYRSNEDETVIQINWQIGIEVELLAPPTKSRLDLAEAICQHYRGRIGAFFHPQSEPSKVPGMPIFHNLTLGYEVVDPDRGWIAKCVDDLTLQADLNRNVPPKAGWYRIVSDDERLLRLIQQQANPQAPLTEVMIPIAGLFGTTPDRGSGGMIRVNDRMGASIAIAAPLPGERERACELITAPLKTHQQEELEVLLGLARSLEFTAPLEGATHIHFDATALQSAPAIANVVNLLWSYGDILKVLMGTNPHCQRLGKWSEDLLATVAAPEFRRLSWEEARANLSAIELTKYCDFNLFNFVHAIPDKNTIELRILPVHLHTQPILEAAALFVAILERSLESKPIKIQAPKKFSLDNTKALLAMLPLATERRDDWLRIAKMRSRSM